MDNPLKKIFPFLTRDDLAFQHGVAFSLRIITQSLSTNKLIIRGMTREGVFSFSHTPTNNSVIKTESFRIPDIPIWVSVVDQDQTLLQGDVFVTLQLVSGSDVLMELASGFVYRQRSLSYPATSSHEMRPMGGKIDVRSGSDPAAGAEASITVPAGQIWHVRELAYTLVTDGTAANRTVMITATKQSVIFPVGLGVAVQTAGLTVRHGWFLMGDDSSATTGNFAWGSLDPNLILQAGDTIQTASVNLQAGDNFGVMTAGIEMWFNPA